MKNKSELVKDMYAAFGVAYFESEVLHRNLCNIFALATFDNPASFTRPRLEEKLDFAFSLTLGQLVNQINKRFPVELQEELSLAVSKRNYLAHHYLFDKNYLMFSEDGLKQLIDELFEYVKFFDELDKEITSSCEPLFHQFGITDELITEITESLQQGEQDEPLLSQRKLKKMECLVRVWDVEVNDGEITQIFETDDGVLWQLCDVGLGWSIFSQPEQHWKENAKINQYLPANINPRPAIVEPWNYDFQLAKGGVLFIRRSKKDKKYFLRIEESK